MKEFIKKNVITVAVLLVVVLMIVNAGLIFYNKNEMIRNNEIKVETESISENTTGLLNNIVHGIDMGVRAYGLTKKESMLDPTKIAMGTWDSYFGGLESRLAAQNYPHIDDLKGLRQRFKDYVDFNNLMIEQVQKDSIEVFKKMLAEDRGLGLYLNYVEVSKKILDFESKINQEAILSYESALNNTTYLQVLLLLVSIPTLGFILFKIKRDDASAINLLKNLEENNRKYIFDPGTEFEITSPGEVIDGSIHNFKRASDFIKQISNGNYDAQWTGLNEANRKLNEANLVGDFMKMKENMKMVKLEDEKRMWATEGLAKFSEIVRNNQSHLENLSNETVRFLVRYLKAQQGNLFIVRDEDENDTHLQLSACYAFDKKKYIEKRIEVGSGLIGQAYLEKETIILKEIPQGYTAITSGLGDATPTCLIIVPLKYNEQIEGVLELAAFKGFEDYQVTFLEKAGEFVASAIMTVKISEKTQFLLQQSQQQAEILKAQEEELRQNMEELEATQEEIARKVVSK